MFLSVTLSVSLSLFLSPPPRLSYLSMFQLHQPTDVSAGSNSPPYVAVNGTLRVPGHCGSNSFLTSNSLHGSPLSNRPAAGGVDNQHTQACVLLPHLDRHPKVALRHVCSVRPSGGELFGAWSRTDCRGRYRGGPIPNVRPSAKSKHSWVICDSTRSLRSASCWI